MKRYTTDLEVTRPGYGDVLLCVSGHVSEDAEVSDVRLDRIEQWDCHRLWSIEGGTLTEAEEEQAVEALRAVWDDERDAQYWAFVNHRIDAARDER